MAALTASPPADFAALNNEVYQDLPGTGTTITAGQLLASQQDATEPVTEQIRFADLGTITVHDTLHLTYQDGKGLAAWSPGMVLPGFAPGDRFKLTASWPRRAPILAADGSPLAVREADGWHAADAALGTGVVGDMGPITAGELHTLGSPYSARSIIGQSGLQAGQERALAGSPGATLTLDNSAGAPVRTLLTVAPRPGAPLRTTIDPTVQRAAEQALAGQTRVAALAAVDARTGTVLAAVSVNAGYDAAVDGEFPPGSTFKILTSTALLEHGMTPASATTCPKTISEDGEVFHNADGDGPVGTMLAAFTESCNTAFIGMSAGNLIPADYPQVARQLGLGRKMHLGLVNFAGSVPLPRDGADQAATAIGQGRVVVSPLDMAIVAAAVDTGTVRSPSLIRGHGGTVLGQLSPAVDSDLHMMMASVVASGTAAGTGLPAGTYAKTGTAEYGMAAPLKLDAWLVGFHGDIAFAALVVDSKTYGGPTCGPIVAKFLDAI
jgi:cell division protein FtsI/penicillin-binding protein 2